MYHIAGEGNGEFLAKEESGPETGSRRAMQGKASQSSTQKGRRGEVCGWASCPCGQHVGSPTVSQVKTSWLYLAWSSHVSKRENRMYGHKIQALLVILMTI